jgi:hypothetical protein
MSNLSFALNGNNDMYLDATGNLATVSGVDAVSQDCLCAMKGQLGEMLYQPLSGLPNLTDVWIQQNLIKWEAAARATLATVPGVNMVKNFTYSISNGVLTYVALIQTIYSASLVTVTDAITAPGVG